MSHSQYCLKCQQLLPETVTEGTCPSCGFAITNPSGTPREMATPAERDGDFALGSDPNATGSHIAVTVREEPAYRKPVPLYPDIPNHTDFEVIGRGGMGTVYKAIQRPVDRAVAVKIVNHYVADSQMRERYLNEVRAHARIRHPGIIPIYEVGDCSHGPYFTMEFQPGGTLANRMKAGRLDDREAARIVADAAEAVHAAHLEGIIHRDIKPSNIMVGANGTVRVTDFGLAKHAVSEDITQTGMIVGTFAYMSPEQASGDPSKVGSPADIYCLGATLFQLLTGRVAHPTKGSNLVTVKEIVHNDSPSPRSLRGNLCETLDAIVQKAMAREPMERYASAAAFAQDLRRWLAKEPTEARPPTFARRLSRRLNRHRAAIAVFGMLAFAFAVAVAIRRGQDPERALKNQLDRRERVELVGPKGLPAYRNWFLGETVLSDKNMADGTASFETQSMAALVLCNDPRHSHYRFSAEIRHVEDFSRSGSVGLFFGLQPIPLPGPETFTRWQRIAYSDFFTLFEKERPEYKPKHGGTHEDSILVQSETNISNLSIGSPRFRFAPATGRPIGWRKIELEVSAAGIAMRWSDDSGEMISVLDRDADTIERNIADHNLCHGPKYWPGREIPRTAWEPRGALGIFAYHSTVAFRNVVLEPLP